MNPYAPPEAPVEDVGPQNKALAVAQGPRISPESLKRAHLIYKLFKRMFATSFLIWLALVLGVRETAVAPYLGFVAVALFVASIFSFALLGNALGRFGPKYLLPVFLIPALGIIYSFFRLRWHLKQADRRSSAGRVARVEAVAP